MATTIKVVEDLSSGQKYILQARLRGQIRTVTGTAKPDSQGNPCFFVKVGRETFCFSHDTEVFNAKPVKERYGAVPTTLPVTS